MRLLFSYQPLSTEFVFAALGVSLAAFWNWNPWLDPFAIAPLVLVHRSLSVPQLQAEARVDPKTGLYNARYFATTLAAELGRAARFERPMSLIMADLDLLRDINNTLRPPRGRRGAEGHRRGLPRGAAPLRRAGALRRRGVLDPPARRRRPSRRWRSPSGSAARSPSGSSRSRRRASRSARRCRSASPASRRTRRTRTSSSTRPTSPSTARKLQGRNRVLGASSEPLLMPAERSAQRVAVPEDGEHREPLARGPEALPEHERRTPRHTTQPARASSSSRPRSRLVGARRRSSASPRACSALLFGTSTDYVGLLAVLALVGVGQALALELDDGSISVSAVGALAGAALFGPRAALAARGHDLRRRLERAAQPAPPRRSSTSARWRSRRSRRRRLHARLRRRRSASSSPSRPASPPARVYFAVNTGLLSLRARASRAARRRGASGTSASSGSRRTTSSTASSAA